MRQPAILLIFAAASLAACAEFPELDSQINEEMRRATYPSFAATQSLQSTPEPRLGAESEAQLAARVAALRSRAARLQGSVVSPSAKERLSAPIKLADN